MLVCSIVFSDIYLGKILNMVKVNCSWEHKVTMVAHISFTWILTIMFWSHYR